ncbi:MAG TPA: M56 family metallopeptidase [Gemmatimonadales bacterium]|jgi:beta-lactamase regulating signal transducer with metallopeptidase domain
MGAIHTLGWTLIHSVWQGTLAAAGLAALLTVVPARAARSRYALSVATLLVMLALPLATGLRMGSEPSWTDAGAHAFTTRMRAVEPALPWVVALWLGGVLLMSTHAAWGWLATQRLRTVGTRPVPEAWRQTLAALATRLRVSRPVRLLASALIAVPAVIGWWRPVILIPVSALTGSGLTPLQLDALLAHELAHVRRHDYFVNLLQSVIETLLFYHPAVWWVSARVRQEREHCCDDLAVAACGDARFYATALFTMEQLRLAAPLAVAASGGSLVGRVRRLVLPPAGATFPRWLAGVVGVGLAMAGVIGGDWSLHRLAPVSTDSLIALATGSHDPAVRHDAVKALGRTTEPRVRATLTTLALNDADQDVRDEAVESLGAAFPGAETVRVLAAIARRDPDKHVRHEAVEVLGEMKHGAGLPEVIHLARTHPDPSVRREAVESIRDEAPRATAVPILREIAQRDPDRDVHRKAARALAKLGEL